MSEAIHIGDVCTVAVPIRRPLLLDSVLDRDAIEVSDQTGVVIIYPGHACEVRKIIDRGQYTLCQTDSGLALIATGDLKLQPTTPPKP